MKEVWSVLFFVSCRYGLVNHPQVGLDVTKARLQVLFSVTDAFLSQSFQFSEAAL